MTHAIEPYSTFFEGENLRPYPVRGDNMEPGLCRGDVALIRPVDDYDGEGVYLVGIEYPNLRRVACTVGKKKNDIADTELFLFNDNERYSRQTITLGHFREIVVAKVCFRLQVFDHAFARDLFKTAGG
jgi:hypothetical protein